MRRSVLAAAFVLCLTPGLGAEETFTTGEGICRFDMGEPEGPVLDGFTKITQFSRYDPGVGFGWVTDLKPMKEIGWSDFKEPVITSRTRPFPDDAARDHVYGFSGYNRLEQIIATFQADIPNGEYIVRICVGDSGVSRGYCPFHIDINDKRVATNVGPGSAYAMDLAGMVTDGKLRIRFEANPEETKKRIARDRWTHTNFTLWTCDYIMVYPAAERDAYTRDLAAFRATTRRNLADRFIPKGRIQKFEIRDGCVVRDGKPMLFNHRHEWSYTEGEFLDWLQYFGFGNAVMTHQGTTRARAGVKFLTPEWETSGDFPAEMFSQATETYNKGMLCTAYGGVLSDLPAAVKRNPLYVGCIDNRGRRPEYPNYNDPIYREWVRQVYANVGRWTKLHPGFIASYPYEEMYYRVWDSSILSYDRTSLRKYREFLKEKYGTVAKLNDAWNSRYESFDAIDPPKQREQTPNFVNFQLHRAKSLVEGYCKSAYEGFKSTDDTHLVIGEKPNGQWFYLNYSLCANGFNYTPYLDIAQGEGGLARNLADIEYWGLPRTNMDRVSPQCTFKDLSEDQLDPWTKQVYGASDYVVCMGLLFRGMKSVYTESYDTGEGARHLIHPTKTFRRQAVKTAVTGETVKFRDVPLADYVIEPQALELARAYQFAYRTAPVLMPTRLRRSDVAHICTEMTTLLGYSLKKATTDYGVQGDYFRIQQLFEQLQRRPDVVTEFGFADAIRGRKVLVAALHATVASRQMVDDVKAFLARGGVIIFSGEAFFYDCETFHSGAASPIAGLSDVFSADMGRITKFTSNRDVVIKDASLTPGLKVGDVLFSGEHSYMTMPVKEGCVVVATVEDKPVIIASRDGKALYTGLPLLGSRYARAVPAEANFRRLMQAFVERSGSVPAVAVTEAEEAHMVRTSVLDGKGHHLVEISNTGPRAQSVKVKLRFLGEGEYSAVDITGESPAVTKNAKHEFHLLRDDRGRLSSGMTTAITADSEIALDLGERGTAYKPRLVQQEQTVDANLRFPPQSRVFLIQPRHVEVTQLLPDYTVRALCRLPVSIVLPDAPTDEEKTAAEEISTLLTAWGTDVNIISPKDVKTVSETKPITWRGYTLETFSGNRFDVDRNLIVIGETKRNTLMEKLYDLDSFTMDKIPMRGVGTGKGTGVIQFVQSVNSLVYDWTDKSADAIIITGADEEGTGKALERFRSILWR